jgi:hypothetical protein
MPVALARFGLRLAPGSGGNRPWPLQGTAVRRREQGAQPAF